MRSLIVIALTLTIVAPLRADEALEKAKARYAAGVKLFNEEKLAEAVAELEAAYALKPIPKFLAEIAKIHRKMGDKTKAHKFAQQFLHEARVGDADRPAIEAMVKEIEGEAEPAGTAPAEVEIPRPVEVPGVDMDEMDAADDAPRTSVAKSKKKARRGQLTTLLHTPVDDANVGKSIPLVAELPAGVEAKRVIVYFRNAGRRSFTRTELREEGYAFVGQIPASQVIASSIQYYLEAWNPAGRPVALSGSPFNPHIIVVTGGRRPSRELVAEAKPQYRAYTWTLLATSGAFVAAGTAFALLARDRATALETAAAESQDARVPYSWDYMGIRDLESEGKTFSKAAKVMFVLAGVAAAGAGTLWYLDLRQMRRTRTELELAGVRLLPFGLQAEFR